MTRRRRALAIGWFGAGNLGDEVMLEGLLRWLDRALGPVDVTVSSNDPVGTTELHRARAIRQRPPRASAWRDLALVRAAFGADLVTLGGGDLLREQADGTVPARNWLARMRVPLALRRPAALVGISVGELVSPDVIAEVAREVGRFGLVAARDEVSAARLAEITGRRVELMGDLALEALEPMPPRNEVSPRDRPPRIGVATRLITGRGPSVAPDAGGHLASALARALDAVVAETGAAVELIPFRAGGRNRLDDDERAGVELAAMARTGAAWFHHPPPPSASAFGGIARDLDLIVSVRLHGVVLGAAAGRRVLGVAYDSKVSNFLADLGVAAQALPLEAGAEEIEEAIRRSLADAGMEPAIRSGVERARDRTRALDGRLRELAGAGAEDVARR